MRKNAVNRQLNPLEGGVCAVAGFMANTARCGFVTGFFGDDVGLILSDKKCAVAFLGNATETSGAPVKTSRKHVKSGFARGVLFNNGIANVYGAQSERLCKLMCWEVAKRLKMDATEFVIASTGEIGKELSLETFVRAVPTLIGDLDFVPEKDFSVAKALDNLRPKQLAFSFELGDFLCKIGAVFKGNKRVAPNFATTLCFMTTDVNISPEMLQKALQTVANDTFNQLSVDCIASPNDCVCILANGKAGNYKITVEDTEYKKFVYALGETVDRICKSLVTNPKENEFAFLCKVKGARSKKLARDVSKAVIQAIGIKEGLARGEVDVQNLIYLLAQYGEVADCQSLEVAVSSSKARIVLLEDNQRLPVSPKAIKSLIDEEAFCIELGLGKGNYSATAYGRKSGLADKGMYNIE